MTEQKSKEIESKKGVHSFVLVIAVIVGFGFLRFGYNVLQIEPVSHWFEGLINGAVQVTGWGSILLGVILVLSPVLQRYVAKL